MGATMPDHEFTEQFLKEVDRQEKFATENGYKILNVNHGFGVSRSGRIIATCQLRIDAVEVAAALARFGTRFNLE